MTESLKKQIESIVKSGENVRARVAEAVRGAAKEAGASASRLADLSEQAMGGAMDAVDRSVPDEAESTLRQVVDGLADAFGQTAQATRLAVEEAAGEGKRYASEDLKSAAEDFQTLGKMFVETVGKGAGALKSEGATQYANLTEHAARAFDRVRPAVEDAARTAAGDPVGLAGDAAASAASVAREAAGGLFSSVGKLLQSAGEKIDPPKK